jgi:hypothetical protein
VTRQEAKLCSTDLLNTNFKGTFWHNVDLRTATITGALLKEIDLIEARVFLLFVLRKGEGNYVSLNWVVDKLREHLTPTSRTEEAIGYQEEHSRIRIHDFGPLIEGSINAGYIDATLDGKKSFDDAVRCLLDLSVIQDAWIHEVSEQRSQPSRLGISERLPHIICKSQNLI